MKKIMKKYVYLMTSALCLTWAEARSYIVSDNDLKISAVDYCPPSNIHYKDIICATGATKETLDRLPKYYVSQLVGLQLDEEPPYEAIQNPSLNREKLKDFSIKMGQFVDGNDECDAAAIKYIARFYKYFCPDSSPYQGLAEEAKAIVKFFFEFPGRVFQKAKIVADCQVVGD